MRLLDQIALNVSAGPDHEAYAPPAPGAAAPAVKAIAFYLPQFHPIPENDAWWGRGFTEWTNVTKAVPRFAGHYQPRLPADLGFYDLRRPETLREQARLAREHGLHGFCFHHYWFSGRRLLQTPLELLLAHPDIDVGFCVNWANESWTRRWDGHEKNVLMPQAHSPEDDVAFARSLEPLFRDPRYIRVAGRPLLMLYRPGLLPDAAATVRRWREHFAGAGSADPYVVMAQAFGEGDPAKYGMDAAVCFPPFWAAGGLARTNDGLELFDPAYRGDVFDYEAMARATLAGHPAVGRVFPGVCPAWDNEARKPGRGVCFAGSTPAKYGAWLRAACALASRAPPEERLVFINAWNEWAEGAYLEPDRRFGFAYLAETARALRDPGPALAAADDGPGGDAPAPFQAAARRRRTPGETLRRVYWRVTARLADLAEDAAWRLRGK